MQEPIAPSVTGTYRLKWRQGAALAAGAVATLAGNASAATIVVNSLADNATAGDGLCTLREALANANSNSDATGGDCAAGSGADVIDLSALTGTITLGGTQLTISDSVTVQGPGPASLTIDANNLSRVFYVYSNASALAVTISGLKLTRGRIGAGRGSVIVSKGENVTLSDLLIDASRPTNGVVTGIANASLSIQNSTITGNTGGSGAGGVYVVGTGATLTIDGSTITGNTSSRGAGVMVRNSTGPVVIANSLITNNTATTGKGGGLFLYSIGSSVTISNSTISGNTTTNRGGGISLYRLNAPLTITDSTISGNTSTNHGGGICLYRSTAPGTMTIQRSTISGNMTTGGTDGGGLFLYRSGSATVLENTTVSGNSATNGGGIDILNPSGGNSLSIRSSTIAFNTAVSLGGNINGGNSANTIGITNSIIAGGTAATGPDIRNGAATVTLNYSLLQNTSGATIGGANNLTGVDPLLAPLANNGGPTQTHLFPVLSAVVNAGDPSGVGLPATDQRGLTRAQGVVDMGSVELQLAPNPFSFTAQTGAPLSTTATSNTITVTGTGSGTTTINIVGGTYSVNGGGYVSTAGTISLGDTVSVRLTTSASYSTLSTATLTIGGVAGAFDVTTGAQLVPNPFSFTAQTGAALSSAATSNTITVTGTGLSPAAISIVGGTYSINGGGFVSTAGTVNVGDTVSVRLTTSASFSTLSTATLTMGGVSGAFNVTTGAALVPGAFSFTAQTGAALSSTATSNTITVTGTGIGAAAISIVGGTYSVNGGGYVSGAGTVNVGDTVSVRLTTSASFSTLSAATLTINGVSGAFNVTTGAALVPGAFSFTAQTGAAVSSTATSNTITVTGTGIGAAAISIVGGTYSVNGGGYVSGAGTVNVGDTVTVRLTTSASFSTLSTATLTIGGVSGAFNVTTVAPVVSYTAPSPTGTGSITASFTGGGAGCSFATAQYTPTSAVAAALPAGVVFPHGLFDFTTSNCGAGATLTVTILYPAPVPGTARYFKYGPEFGGSPIPHWYVVPITIAGNQVSFTVTDNGQGDNNPAAGFISDPGGLAVLPGSAVAIPTLSGWAMFILAGLMAFFGFRKNDRRERRS